MKIEIGITTYHRVEKLERLLQSIGACLPTPADPEQVRISIMYSDAKDMEEVFNAHHNVPDSVIPLIATVELEGEFHSARVWNEFFRTTDADVVVYLCDDVEVEPDFLLKVRNAMKTFFPQMDGLLGFHQSNLTEKGIDTCKAAFGAMGKGFMDMFPNRAVFCPDYGHLWIDRELQSAAEYHRKFRWCSGITIKHHHPAADKANHDATHDEIRARYRQQDMVMHQTRMANGWIWGKSFNLVGDK